MQKWPYSNQDEISTKTSYPSLLINIYCTLRILFNNTAAIYLRLVRISSTHISLLLNSLQCIIRSTNLQKAGTLGIKNIFRYTVACKSTPTEFQLFSISSGTNQQPEIRLCSQARYMYKCRYMYIHCCCCCWFVFVLNQWVVWVSFWFHSHNFRQKLVEMHGYRPEYTSIHVPQSLLTLSVELNNSCCHKSSSSTQIANMSSMYSRRLLARWVSRRPLDAHFLEKISIFSHLDLWIASLRVILDAHFSNPG